MSHTPKAIGIITLLVEKTSKSFAGVLVNVLNWKRVRYNGIWVEMCPRRLSNVVAASGRTGVLITGRYRGGHRGYGTRVYFIYLLTTLPITDRMYYFHKRILSMSIFVVGSNPSTSPSISSSKQLVHITTLPMEKHSLTPAILCFP